ncbi:uncharacterized protein METZ01_LOCUS508392, partial [marine metagenome]
MSEQEQLDFLVSIDIENSQDKEVERDWPNPIRDEKLEEILSRPSLSQQFRS